MTMNNIVRLNTAPSTRDDWCGYLQSGQHEAAGSMIEYCKRIHEYKLSCPSTKGGSTFTADCLEWLGIDKDTSSRLSLIGSKYVLLSGASLMLPESPDALNQLRRLPEDAFNKAVELGRIHRGMTIGQAEELLKGFKRYKEILTSKEQHIKDIEYADLLKKLKAQQEVESKENAQRIIDKASADYELPEGADPKQAEEYEAESNKLRTESDRITRKEAIDEMYSIARRYSHPDKASGNADAFKRLKDLMEAVAS